MNIETFMANNKSDGPCVAWDIQLKYDLGQFSKIEATLETKPAFCNENVQSHDYINYYNIHIIRVGSAIWH